MVNPNENFDYFLEANLHKFAGKWIAIVDKNVVGSGSDLKKMLKEVKKKYPKKEPLVARAPSEKPLIL